MKKQVFIFSLLLLLFIIGNSIQAGGTVIIDGFTPTTPGIEPSPSNIEGDPFRYFEIYLPDGYNNPGNTTQYPVVYFLHGFGQNHTSYGGMFLLLDTMIASGQLAPMIVVKPDGSLSNGFLGSFFVNSTLNGDFEDYIVTELRNFVNTNYRTLTDVSSTAIAGHSMGAYGAYLLTIKHPGIYSSVVAHTPSTIIAMEPQISNPNFYDNVLEEIPSSGPGAGKILPTNGQHTYQLFAMSAALSPNPASPFLVDLPIVVNPDYTPVITAGHLTPDPVVIAQWLMNDPYTLVSNSFLIQTQLRTQFLYTDIGNQEALIDTTGAKLFVALLNARNIPNIFRIYPGTSFPQPGLFSPSNDGALEKFFFPLIELTAQFLEADPFLQLELEVNFIPPAIDFDPVVFSNITLGILAGFLNVCGLSPATIGQLFADPNFTNCLIANGITPDEWFEDYFSIPGNIALDPIRFSVDTDGFLPIPESAIGQALINKFCPILLFHSF